MNMNSLMRSGLILLSAITLAACSNTWTGVGKDLQEMGKKMDPQAKPVETAPNPSSAPSTNTNNKDVTVTPVK
jgi:predicted small secreted protein